jgi:hypothetical protein
MDRDKDKDYGITALQDLYLTYCIIFYYLINMLLFATAAGFKLYSAISPPALSPTIYAIRSICPYQ